MFKFLFKNKALLSSFLIILVSVGFFGQSFNFNLQMKTLKELESRVDKQINLNAQDLVNEIFNKNLVRIFDLQKLDNYGLIAQYGDTVVGYLEKKDYVISNLTKNDQDWIITLSIVE